MPVDLRVRARGGYGRAEPGRKPPARTPLSGGTGGWSRCGSGRSLWRPLAATRRGRDTCTNCRSQYPSDPRHHPYTGGPPPASDSTRPASPSTDPSQFPDENPLAQKQGGSSPTPEEVRQYADGVVDPASIVNDNSYTYRGVDESKLNDSLNVYPTHLGTSPRYHAK